MEKKENIFIAKFFNIGGLILLLSFTSSVIKADPIEDFKNLIIQETEYFILESVEFDEEAMFLSAEYSYKPLDEKVVLYLEYGSRDHIREVLTSFSRVYDITHGLDRGNLWDLISRQEMREIGYRFNELVNAPALFRWQYEHGSLMSDNPSLELLPIEAGPFRMSSFAQSNPMEIQSSYLSEESGERFSVTLLHGEAAKMYNSVYSCNYPSHQEVDVQGRTFYTEHREIRNSNQADARYYEEGIAIELSYSYGDGYGQNPDEETINNLLAEYFSSLDMENIHSYNYPPIEGPGYGIEPVSLNADEFSEFFSEPADGLVLQDVVVYDDAMHVRADYFYEPDNIEFSYHLAYGDYRDRLQMRVGGGFIGNFNKGYEICLSDGVNHFDIFGKIEDPSDEDLIQWELENVDLSQANPLAAYFPLEVGDYAMKDFISNPEVLQFTGEYEHTETGETIGVSATYGDDGVRNYNRFHLGAFEEGLTRFESQGVTFYGMVIRSEFRAFTLLDNTLIQAGVVEEGNADAAISKIDSFLSEINAAKFAAFEAPEGYAMNFDGTLPDGSVHCLDTDCMDTKMATCEEAGFGGNMPGRLGVLYKVEEPNGNKCRMSMMYTRNPNSKWEEQPLYFSLDRNAGFRDSAPVAVTDCMEGRTEEHNCSGPLLDIINE